MRSSSTGPSSSPPRAADAPRELATRVKATLRQAPWQPAFDDALRFELEHQVWSFRQPEFTERMKAPREASARVTRSSRSTPTSAHRACARLRSRPVNQVIDPTDAEALDAIPVGPSPARTLGIAAAWIAVGLVIGLALWLFWTNVVDPERQLGGRVVRRRRLAASCTRRCGTGSRSSCRRRRAGASATDADGPTIVVDSRPGAGYSFSVTRVAPARVRRSRTTSPTLNTAAGLARATGRRRDREPDATRSRTSTSRSRDVVFRKGNEYYRNLLVLAPDRLFIVQAKVKGKDPAPFNRLWK